MPQLSVITPTLNAAQYLESALQSVAACKNHVSVEHIVIDGGSTDETLSILEGHRNDVRIQVEPRLGRAAAISLGMSIAEGDIIGWLDADDVYFSDGISAAMDHLALQPDTDVLYGPSKIIDEDGRAYRKISASQWSLSRIQRKNVILPPAVLFRRSLISDCAHLDPSLLHHFDYDFWLQLALSGRRFARFPALLGGKRRHRRNRFFGSSDKKFWHESATELLQVVQRRLPNPSVQWALNYGHVMAACRDESRETSLNYDRIVMSEASKVLADWCGKDCGGYGADLLLHHVARECNHILRFPRYLTRFLTYLEATLQRPFRRKIFRLRHHKPRTLRLPASYYKDANLISGTPLSISIVTPNLNGPLLEETLRSVVDQGYPQLEYIVQDGGSSDENLAVLRRFDSQLKHWESRPDKGQANAINCGMKRSTGDVLAYLNSDDILLPGALSFVARFFNEHPNVDVVYGNRILIDEEGDEIGRWVLPTYDEQVIQWADYIPQETMFWRRRAWKAVNESLDESFEFAMDWDLILRFRAAGMRFRHVPRFLGAFRVWDCQKTMRLMETVGQTEMNRLRERELGFVPSEKQIRRVIKPFIWKQWVSDCSIRAA